MWVSIPSAPFRGNPKHEIRNTKQRGVLRTKIKTPSAISPLILEHCFGHLNLFWISIFIFHNFEFPPKGAYLLNGFWFRQQWTNGSLNYQWFLNTLLPGLDSDAEQKSVVLSGESFNTLLPGLDSGWRIPTWIYGAESVSIPSYRVLIQTQNHYYVFGTVMVSIPSYRVLKKIEVRKIRS